MSDLKVSLILQLKNLLGSGLKGIKGDLRALKDETKGLGSVKGPSAAGLAAYANEARRSAIALREIKREQAALGRASGSGNTIIPAMGPVGRTIGGVGVGLLAGAAGTAAAALQLRDAAKVAAEAERAMTRIGITGDATKGQQWQAAQDIDRLAHRTAQSTKDIREGLDSLVAAGRSLPDAMAFLPSVAETAQASGATVLDIAKTADAVSGSMEVAAERMGDAFDIMATGGKLGKFELKDMAQYLPELAPMAKEAGMKGTEGLTSLVSALQMVRKEVGTSGEAATNLKNVFSKMFSSETEKKFEKMGVDLPKEMEKAKKEGKNLLDTFVALTMTATKGDMTKLPKLFEDMQAQAGMRALINNAGAMKDMVQEIGKASSGTVAKDLKRVLEDSQSGMDKVSGAASRLGKNIGNVINSSRAASGVLGAMAEGLNRVNDAMERSEEIQRKLDEAGIKPIPNLKTQAEADAERVTSPRMSDEELKALNDGGFHRKRPKDTRSALQKAEDARLDVERTRLAMREAEAAESRRLAARDPASRAQEAAEIASGSGAIGAALGDAMAQRWVQRKAGNTAATILQQIDVQEKWLNEALSALDGSRRSKAAGGAGLGSGAEARKQREAESYMRAILHLQKQKDGGVGEPTKEEVGNALQQRLKALEEQAGSTANSVKDKLTMDLTSQGATTALSWANGLRAGIPAVQAAADALRAPLMTPAAPIGGGGRPTTGGGATGPAKAPSVQVGAITVNGAGDPERAARLVEQRLSGAIRSALAGAHHDGVA